MGLCHKKCFKSYKRMQAHYLLYQKKVFLSFIKVICQVTKSFGLKCKYILIGMNCKLRRMQKEVVMIYIKVFPNICHNFLIGVDNLSKDKWYLLYISAPDHLN